MVTATITISLFLYVYWNSLDFTNVKEMFFSDYELDRCTISKGDMLMCEGGAYYGRTAMPGLSSIALHQMIILLPPLEEQHRIVTKVEGLLPYCDQLVESL